MSWTDTPLTQTLGLAVPIIQAPMLGASTPAMARAAGRAGALGSMGCSGLGAEALSDLVGDLRQNSNAPFNLNFFAHAPPQEDADRAARAIARLQPWYDRFDLGEVKPPSDPGMAFDAETLEAVLAAAPPVVSFHFGLPEPALMKPLQGVGIKVMSSATSVAEAVWLEDRGVDVIIAQGYEAGGHNGWFLPRGAAQVTGTMALVPRIVDAVSVPVVAAGGIADGRGIAAAMILGAAGVQIGTAFLASPECAAPQAHKDAVLAASGDDTAHTAAFSGRIARSVVNAYVTEMADVDDWPDFPMMNTATGPLRAASVKAGSGAAVSLWSGQAAGLVRETGTEEILRDLIAQADGLLGG